MMKFRLLLAAWFPLLTLLATSVSAQHAGDIEFGYDNLATPTSLEIEAFDFTTDGVMYFESAFEELDPFNAGDFSADEPGFNTNAGETLLVNPGDQIWLRALDASLHSAFGLGYVNYFNPTTGALESFGRISVLDNSGSTSDLVLNGGGIESGSEAQFIAFGDTDGDIHDHLIFDLLDDSTTPLGAYGVMFQMESDFDPADGSMDLTSDSFWIVFNHGMTASDFEARALPAFGVAAVPEPSSAALLFLGAAVYGGSRRKRRAV